jgi:hypothetical protein
MQFQSKISYLSKIAIVIASDKYLLFARLWKHHLSQAVLLHASTSAWHTEATFRVETLPRCCPASLSMSKFNKYCSMDCPLGSTYFGLTQKP